MVVQLINSYLGYTLTHPYTHFSNFFQYPLPENTLKLRVRVCKGVFLFIIYYLLFIINILQ